MSLIDKIFSNKSKKIIAIDGEYGSGAYNIAANIAEKENIKFYDSKLIELMTLEKKVKPEDLSKDDSFLQGTIYDLYRENYSYSQEDIAFSDAQFLMDSRTIRDIAKKGQCVILGKCADYVLGDDIVLSVFIYASEDFKLNRIEKDYNIKKDKIETKMNREDMKRKNHYERNTGRLWGKSSVYDLSIDSSAFSFDTIEDIIIKLANKKIR
ncbi:cytidylate kinase-like family protein [Peptoniphilus lacrimalis]|uniref:Cytidylate kinase n=1 Tax=Peptoniphilus lacrimalis TaxID=33031 RepID=A0A379C6H6_9FIRM|nr:cytidylate kinase-like family protein [Peptoniphilus lacrimalis]SUB57853.1 cytidylate kinase [Peptoniphilus lacrimalis]